jgi:carboxyl-terminal processing protease
MSEPGKRERATELRAAARGSLLVLAALCIWSLFLTRVPSLAQNTRDKGPDYQRLFRDVASHLSRYYLDLSRLNARALVGKAFSAIEAAVDEIYVDNSDPTSPVVTVHIGDKSQVFDLTSVSDLDDCVRLLESVLDLIKKHYKGETPLNEIRYAAINGFLSGLDPHTLVFSPEDFKDFSVHIEGEICGVGMYVGSRDGKLTVIEVLKGTPAQKAGFKKQDQIVKIGDESTINMTVNEAVDKIRGACGSRVTLTIKRASADDPERLEPLDIAVGREKVVIKSVESALIKDWDKDGSSPWKGGVGYVQVTNFDKNTTPSLELNLKRLQEENEGRPLAGLILDFRGNSGGLLTQAVAMTDMFLKSGSIVIQANRGGKLTSMSATDDLNEPDYPIVLLANEASASGAEIVIGALQKNDRALVLGTRTFGKGSVQQLHELHNDAQLKITVSEYLIPGEISIQENGVVPDLLAEAVLDETNFDLFANERSVTEKSYESHLVSRFAKKESPKHTLHYFYELDEPEDTFSDRFMSGELKPEKDKLVQVALGLLRFAGKPFRPDEILETRQAEIKKLKSELFQEIVDRMQKKGIDWSADPSGAPSAVVEGQLELELSTRRIQEPSKEKDDPVPVNKLEVTARLKNKGDKPVYRMKGLSRSEFFLYKDQELLFGKVGPGETVERSVKVRLPYFPHARNDLFTVEVSPTGEMPDGDAPPTDAAVASRSIQVELKDEGRPAFAYSGELLSTATAKPITELGEGVEALFRVKIKNTGTAPVYKGIAILRNETGRQVFLHPPGRIELKDLAPGAEAQVEFRFEIRPGEPVEEYKLELVAADSYSNASLSRKLSIPRQGSTGAVPFPNGMSYVPPAITATVLDPETQKPVLLTSKERLSLEALIKGTDVEKFKAWVVSSSAGEHEAPDKIFFADSQGERQLKIATTVPLKKGINLFTIVSNDRNGLESRQSLVVRRE